MNPHNLPLPPSGPPMMGGPPQIMSHRGGGGGGMGGRSPFTNTILITNMPPFFIGYQQVRDWLYPCGTAKTCLFYPRVPKRKKNNNNNNSDDGDNNKAVGDIEMMIANEGGEVKDGNETNNKKKTVLINMINPDQALKVVASFKMFAGQLDDRYKDIRCYMVPSSPDIPLPPPLVDETTKKVLGEKLWHNFISLETSYSDSDHKNNSGVEGSSSNTTGAAKTTTTPTTTKGDTAEESDKTNDAKDNSNKDTISPSDGNELKLLDANKVEAAAGGVGTYDADEDPLNAPQVLEAVKEFRRKLDRTHGSQKTQRMDLVAKKLKELRPRIRAQVIAEKTNRRQNNNTSTTMNMNTQRLPPGALPPLPAPPQNTSLPQPPRPQGGAPPPSLGLPPPPRAAAADSGKRGRSNLPAWMTKQQQQQQTSTSDDPASKKARTTTEQYPSHFPSALPPSSHPVLRQFLANQVKESMGEEEATLIDFLYTHILQGKATSELLQELQVVLEEEADGFLKAVWTKVQEIQQQQ